MMSNKVNTPNGDSAELMHLLELGLGRAILFLRGKDTSKFRNVITYACRNNLVFDIQCEGSRAQYMFDVIQATGEPEYYAPYVCEALRSSTDERDLDQLFELVLLLAQHGYREARSALYDAFNAQPVQKEPPFGGKELVTLDGIDGLAHIARRMPQPEQDSNYLGYVAVICVEILDKQMGKEAGRAALGSLSENDLAVARLMNEVDRYEATVAERRQKRPPLFPLTSYEEFQQLLSSEDKRLYRYRWRRWGEEADETFVRRAADDLMAETDPKRLLRLLHFFEERAFPGGPDLFLNLMASNDEKMARAARMALRNVVHPKTRAKAIELMTDSEWADDGLDMLSNNCQPGDGELVMAALARDLSDDQFHWINFSVRDFYKKHPSPASKAALTILYERLRCTMCRESVVEMLMELGPLPDWMIEECRYDANLDLRRLVGS